MSNKSKVNILRVILCAILLCALVVGTLWLFLRANDVAAEKLEELNPKKTGDMKNMLWLIEKVLYILPVCTLLIFQTLVYKMSKTKKSITHRERAWELIIAFVFTYAVLLPMVLIYSKNNPPVPDPETGVEALSLAARSVQWFMWQILIFMPAILYHRVMANSCVDEELTTENEGTEIEE